MKSFLFEWEWSCHASERVSAFCTLVCVCVCVCVQCISIIMHYNNLLRIKMHCAQNSYVSVYGWAVMLIILIGLNKKALCKATIIENTLALTTFMVHIVHSMFLGYSFVRSFGCCFFFSFKYIYRVFWTESELWKASLVRKRKMA